MLKQHFLMMAAYNAWANARVYDAATALSDDEFAQDTGAFFRSLRGTLNHLLVTDRVWLHRFTQEGDAPKSLDAVLFDRLGPLRAARDKEDQRILSWVKATSEDGLNGRFTYTTVSDMRRVSQRVAPALHHLFNHQTHHRGQAHMILTVLGQPSLTLDLVAFQRTEEGRVFA